jgi:3-hydroxyisobutyrate dehydrogenase-like beta-hydroxyacid dehydrogenase
MHMAAIGFIGLGNMGGPMAANLIKTGGHVLGFDLIARLREGAAGDGVQIVANARATVEVADVVITMLPGGEQVLSVWNDIVPHARQGTLFIVRPSTWRVRAKRMRWRPRTASPHSTRRSRAASAAPRRRR